VELEIISLHLSLSRVKNKLGNKFPLLADLSLNARFLVRKDKTQFGESELLKYVIQKTQDSEVSYLELGCSHPITYSNSWGLPKHWKGIHVDANRDLEILWRIFRPKDLMLPLAVTCDANQREVKYFHFPRRHSVLNTTVPEFTNSWEVLNLQIQQSSVPALSIGEILEVGGVLRAHLTLVLCDVEGYDKIVMETLIDTEKLRPSWILVEDFDGSIERFLQKNKYIKINSTGPSSLFESIEAVAPGGIRSEAKVGEAIASKEMS
jgi:hypothetical protein